MPEIEYLRPWIATSPQAAGNVPAAIQHLLSHFRIGELKESASIHYNGIDKQEEHA